MNDWNGWKFAALATIVLTLLALWRPDALGPLREFTALVFGGLKGLIPG